MRIPILKASGVAHHPQRKTLFIISDRGQVVEMDLKCGVVRRFRLRGDLEYVTILCLRVIPRSLSTNDLWLDIFRRKDTLPGCDFKESAAMNRYRHS